MLVAHGFGGTKASVDADARALVDRGFVVLAWTARGFGASGGQIALDSPDYEVADARALVDRLAARPEVVQDGPGDPRVGVTGGSYGGALALLLAGYDRRIDAVAPVITWNDLGQALFPNAAAAPGSLPADTPARGAFAPTGCSSAAGPGCSSPPGLAPGGGPRGAVEGEAYRPTGRRSGRPVPTGGTGPGHRSPAAASPPPSVPPTPRPPPPDGSPPPPPSSCAAPPPPRSRTGSPLRRCVVQGEADTLFGLDQADATARQIAAAGGTVRVLWYGGGHDGGGADQRVRDAIGDWFDHWLAGTATTRARASATPSRAACARAVTRPPAAPSRHPPTPASPVTPAVSTQPLPLDGDPQVALVPPGGNPAAITSLPGLGGALGNVGNRIAAFTAELPGQSAAFRTAPVAAPLLVAGAPRVDLTVARVPGQPAPDAAVLFGKVYEVTADGTRTLLGGAVAPVRVAVPADGSPARVTVTLPGVVAPIEAGNRLMVSFGTTDQGYAGTTDPGGLADRARRRRGRGARRPGRARRGRHREHRAARAAARHRRGARRGAARDGGGPAAAPPRRRGAPPRGPVRRSDAPPPAAGAPDVTAARPLEIRDLAKTYRGGFSAVHDVSFDVERGMVLGLLGPNGAGKTTVLRMLMGLIRPDGRHDPGLRRAGRAPARRCWPASGPSSRAPVSCRTCPAWRTCGSTGRRPAGRPRRRTSTTPWRSPGSAARCGAASGTYSHGMRQRLAIAQAMLGLPELLVLDEPTNGLDPPQIHAMREVLQRYAAAGRTVLVSSHLLAEVEQTCSHVVVMHQGVVVASGTVDDIIAGGGAASFTVDAPERAAAVLGGLDGVAGRRGRGRRRARRARRHPPVGGGARAGHRRASRCARPVHGVASKTRSCSSWERTRPDDRPDGRGQATAGRRGRRDAAPGPSTVAGHVGALPLVDHAPYRPERTLPVRVELVRQLRRRRTQVAFALVALLPVILWIAFELGDDGPPGGAPNLVDLAKGSGANFAVFALFASAGFLLVVVVALFFGDTVAAEASWSSLRYLLAAPIPRARLLRQKAIVAGLLSLAALLLLPVVALLVGTLAYGANDLVSPTGESLPFAAGASRVLLGALYVAVHLCWVAGLAMLLSVSTDAPLGAVGGAVMASIVSQILDQITALDELRDYLPTHFGTAWSGLLADQIDWGDMTRGAFSAVAYAAVFFAAAVVAVRAQGHHELSGSGARRAREAPRGARWRACRSAAAARTTATPRRRPRASGRG